LENRIQRLAEAVGLRPRHGYLTTICISLLVVTVALPSSAFSFIIGPKGIGPYGFDNDVVAVGFGVMMSIQERGEAKQEYRLVNLSVRDTGAQKKVEMQWIVIEPWKRRNGKVETFLQMRHYTTDDGGIRNIAVQDNVVSFEIPGEYPRYPYKISCTTNRPWLREIRVTRVLPVYFSEPDSAEMYTEVWVMTDRIVLPSLEVFGIDSRKPKWWLESE